MASSMVRVRHVGVWLALVAATWMMAALGILVLGSALGWYNLKEVDPTEFILNALPVIGISTVAATMIAEGMNSRTRSCFYRNQLWNFLGRPVTAATVELYLGRVEALNPFYFDNAPFDFTGPRDPRVLLVCFHLRVCQPKNWWAFFGLPVNNAPRGSIGAMISAICTIVNNQMDDPISHPTRGLIPQILIDLITHGPKFALTRGGNAWGSRYTISSLPNDLEVVNAWYTDHPWLAPSAAWEELLLLLPLELRSACLRYALKHRPEDLDRFWGWWQALPPAHQQENKALWQAAVTFGSVKGRRGLEVLL